MMSRRTPSRGFIPWRIRPGFWALLVFAVIFAVSAPTAILVRHAHTALRVEACVWPKSPQLGSPAHLVIRMANAADRAEVRESGGQLDVRWDMLAMKMSPQHATLTNLSESLQRTNAIQLPLSLDMAGAWTMSVTISTPGRPAWRQVVTFTVDSASNVGQSAPARSMSACEGGQP